MSAATETKKPSRFKESMQKTGAKAKAYANKKYQSAKTYANNYRGDLTKAYDIGYKRGWDDAYDVPKRVGARTAAACGYKKGLKNRKKADTYTERYNKGKG